MQSILPEHLDFVQKADLGCEIKGKWPVARLNRLTDLLLNDSGELNAELEFGRKGKLRYITGKVSTEVEVACQRCMQPMLLKLDANIKLGLISSEEYVDRLPEGYDPWLVSDKDMSLAYMLEEELLLVVPLVAMHEEDCSDYLQEQEKRKQTENIEETEKKNPFSVLKDLL